jgi:hypothetical protein
MNPSRSKDGGNVKEGQDDHDEEEEEEAEAEAREVEEV